MAGKETLNKIIRALISTVATVDVGTVGVVSIPANTYVDVTVKFNKKFASNPFVFAGFNSNSVSGGFGRCGCAYLTDSISNTGCKLRVFNGDVTDRGPTVNWMAVSLKFLGGGVRFKRKVLPPAYPVRGCVL